MTDQESQLAGQFKIQRKRAKLPVWLLCGAGAIAVANSEPSPEVIISKPAVPEVIEPPPVGPAVIVPPAVPPSGPVARVAVLSPGNGVALERSTTPIRLGVSAGTLGDGLSLTVGNRAVDIPESFKDSQQAWEYEWSPIVLEPGSNDIKATLNGETSRVEVIAPLVAFHFDRSMEGWELERPQDGEVALRYLADKEVETSGHLKSKALPPNPHVTFVVDVSGTMSAHFAKNGPFENEIYESVHEIVQGIIAEKPNANIYYVPNSDELTSQRFQWNEEVEREFVVAEKTNNEVEEDHFKGIEFAIDRAEKDSPGIEKHIVVISDVRCKEGQHGRLIELANEANARVHYVVVQKYDHSFAQRGSLKEVISEVGSCIEAFAYFQIDDDPSYWMRQFCRYSLAKESADKLTLETGGGTEVLKVCVYGEYNRAEHQKYLGEIDQSRADVKSVLVSELLHSNTDWAIKRDFSATPLQTIDGLYFHFSWSSSAPRQVTLSCETGRWVHTFDMREIGKGWKQEVIHLVPANFTWQPDWDAAEPSTIQEITSIEFGYSISTDQPNDVGLDRVIISPAKEITEEEKSND